MITGSDDVALAASLDQALALLERNGTLHRTQERWIHALPNNIALRRQIRHGAVQERPGVHHVGRVANEFAVLVEQLRLLIERGIEFDLQLRICFDHVDVDALPRALVVGGAEPGRLAGAKALS